MLKEHGVFLTQQVGGMDCRGINEALGASINREYENWHLATAQEELEKSGFEVMVSKEEFPVQSFYDIGALIYYLNAIPWQVPGFNVSLYEKKLYEIHKSIQTEGFFDVKQHRFVLKARAI